MPYIFIIFKEIMNIDIGTIVVYTCRNSCQTKKYIEEYGYIQRSGEKIVEIENLKKIDDNGPTQLIELDEKTVLEDLNKFKIKGNSNNKPDDDGFIEIKKKK